MNPTVIKLFGLCFEIGNLSEIVACIATIVAGGWVLFMYRADRRTRRADQASQIYFNVEYAGISGELSIYNPSDQRISDPFFLVKESKFPRFREGQSWWPESALKADFTEKKAGGPRMVHPGERMSVTCTYSSASAAGDSLSDRSAVVFKDVRGGYWIKKFGKEMPKKIHRKRFLKLKP